MKEDILSAKIKSDRPYLLTGIWPFKLRPQLFTNNPRYFFLTGFALFAILMNDAII
jgi:hypothetical protein